MIKAALNVLAHVSWETHALRTGTGEAGCRASEDPAQGWMLHEQHGRSYCSTSLATLRGISAILVRVRRHLTFVLIEHFLDVIMSCSDPEHLSTCWWVNGTSSSGRCLFMPSILKWDFLFRPSILRNFLPLLQLKREAMTSFQSSKWASECLTKYWLSYPILQKCESTLAKAFQAAMETTFSFHNNSTLGWGPLAHNLPSQAPDSL